MLQWRWLLARLVGLIISALERFWRGVRVRLGDCVVVERDLGGGEKSWKGEVCGMVVRVWGEACCGGESSSSGMIRQCRGVEWREEVFGRGEQYCGGEEMVAFGVYPVGSQLPALVSRVIRSFASVNSGCVLGECAS